MTLSKEIKSLGGKFLPWPADGLHIRRPDGPPKGLRLSQPCGSCCILDYFLDRPSVVNEGVSTSGHMLADMFIQGLLEPVTELEVEKIFQWAPKAFSGMDIVVDPTGTGKMSENPYTCHYEIKTTSKDTNPKPTKANREQVIRQRVVMARHYGITDKELMPSAIFIISKDGKNTNWVYKPFEVSPTAEELQTAQQDIDLRVMCYEDIIEDGLQDDPTEHPLLKDLRKGSCTRCFPLRKGTASEALTELFTDGKKEWERWIVHDEMMKTIKERKDKVKELVPAGETVETDYFLIRHTESNRIYINPKNLKG